MSGPFGKVLGGLVSGVTRTADKLAHDVEGLAQQAATKVKQAVDTFEGGVVQPVLQAGQRNQVAYQPPVMVADAGAAQYAPVAGQLFVNGVSADDVVQGGAGDCYLLASMSAVAETHPDLIQGAITANADGTYTVGFHEVAAEDGLRDLGLAGMGLEQVIQVLHLPAGSRSSVTVDGQLPTEDGLGELYAQTPDDETWAAVMEKGFAKWWGSYTAVGSGGSPGLALTALTGASVDRVSVGKAGLDPLWTQLTEAQAAGQPMVVDTASKVSVPGVVADHAYTVLGTSVEGGQRYVELRNPWAMTEPGSDGQDDGTFKMKLADFAAAYDSLYIART
jgi:hypothetical protein